MTDNLSADSGSGIYPIHTSISSAHSSNIIVTAEAFSGLYLRVWISRADPAHTEIDAAHHALGRGRVCRILREEAEKVGREYLTEQNR